MAAVFQQLHLGGFATPCEALAQTVIELFENSVDACLAKSREDIADSPPIVRIAVRARDQSGIFGVSCSDTGIGIDRSNVKHLFTAMHRTLKKGGGSDTAVAPRGQYGVGLKLCALWAAKSATAVGGRGGRCVATKSSATAVERNTRLRVLELLTRSATNEGGRASRYVLSVDSNTGAIDCIETCEEATVSKTATSISIPFLVGDEEALAILQDFFSVAGLMLWCRGASSTAQALKLLRPPPMLIEYTMPNCVRKHVDVPVAAVLEPGAEIVVEESNQQLSQQQQQSARHRHIRSMPYPDKKRVRRSSISSEGAQTTVASCFGVQHAKHVGFGMVERGSTSADELGGSFVATVVFIVIESVTAKTYDDGDSACSSVERGDPGISLSLLRYANALPMMPIYDTELGQHRHPKDCAIAAAIMRATSAKKGAFPSLLHVRATSVERVNQDKGVAAVGAENGVPSPTRTVPVKESVHMRLVPVVPGLRVRVRRIAALINVDRADSAHKYRNLQKDRLHGGRAIDAALDAAIREALYDMRRKAPELFPTRAELRREASVSVAVPSLTSNLMRILRYQPTSAELWGVLDHRVVDDVRCSSLNGDQTRPLLERTVMEQLACFARNETKVGPPSLPCSVSSEIVSTKVYRDTSNTLCNDHCQSDRDGTAVQERTDDRGGHNTHGATDETLDICDTGLPGSLGADNFGWCSMGKTPIVRRSVARARESLLLPNPKQVFTDQTNFATCTKDDCDGISPVW